MATEFISMHDVDRRVVALETHCRSCSEVMERIEDAIKNLESAVVNMKVKTAWNAGAIGALVGSGVVALVVGVIWQVLRGSPGGMP